MGLYGERVLPHLLHHIMGRALFRRERPRCVGAARGRVLEIGLGSGFNLEHYRGVREVLAVEPNHASRRLARRALKAAPMPVRWIELEGDTLALEDAAVDCVVSTWTLCSVPDLAQTLRELARVLRPGGTLHFLEHGRAPDPRTARWQDRLTPLQRKIAGGCHLNRDIPRELEAAGWRLFERTEFELARPRLAGHSFLGRAQRP